MSISTYSELQTAVETWLHSSTYTSLIPTFIQQGESRLNDSLSLSKMQAFDTLTASTLSRFVTLPDRFKAPISVFLVISGSRVELTQLTPEKLADEIVLSSGEPTFYSVGEQLEFDCTPSSAYSIYVHFYKLLDIATDLTNFLLTSNPNAYLYASLIAAWTYREDDAKVQKYEALLEAELNRLKGANNSIKTPQKLRVDSGLLRSNVSNILVG